MPNFSADFSKLFFKISQYDSPVMLPSITIKLPTHDNEKQLQHLTLPPPCLTVGMVHSDSNSSLGKRHTMTLLSNPKRSNLLSSDQIILFRKVTDQFVAAQFVAAQFVAHSIRRHSIRRRYCM